MDLDQESNLVLSVLRGQDNRWHVTEQGFGQPFDSFDSPHEACAWAVARAEPKRGRVFVEKALVNYSGSAANLKIGRRPPTQFRDFLRARKAGTC